MTRLTHVPVEICYTHQGKVDQIDSIEEARGLDHATEIIRSRFPEAVFVPCCGNEPDGGCVFVYASAVDGQRAGHLPKHR